MTPSGEASATDRPARLTLQGFADSVQREVFNVDRGLLGTWLQLWRRPGSMIRRYVDWRDPRLTPPVRYAIVLLALSALLLHGATIGADFIAGFQQGYSETDQSPTPDAAWGDVVGRHLDWWLYLVAIPAMGAALEGVYRAHINWAEALAFATYALAQISLGIALLVVLLAQLFDYAGVAPVLLAPIYFAAACYGYFAPDGAGLGRALSAMVLMFAYVLLFTTAIGVASFPLIRAFG